MSLAGSCGERDSPMGSSTFSSPGFPTSYPPNLDCRWEIGGMGNLRVNLTIFFLRLELQHDVLRVFDGCCENRSGLLDEFTGPTTPHPLSPIYTLLLYPLTPHSTLFP